MSFTRIIIITFCHYQKSFMSAFAAFWTTFRAFQLITLINNIVHPITNDNMVWKIPDIIIYFLEGCAMLLKNCRINFGSFFQHFKAVTFVLTFWTKAWPEKTEEKTLNLIEKGVLRRNVTSGRISRKRRKNFVVQFFINSYKVGIKKHFWSVTLLLSLYYYYYYYCPYYVFSF